MVGSEGRVTDLSSVRDGPCEIAGSFDFEPKVLIIADTVAIIADNEAPRKC